MRLWVKGIWAHWREIVRCVRGQTHIFDACRNLNPSAMCSWGKHLEQRSFQYFGCGGYGRWGAASGFTQRALIADPKANGLKIEHGLQRLTAFDPRVLAFRSGISFYLFMQQTKMFLPLQR